MVICEIQLTNFRNFEKVTIPLDPGFNLVVGQNAQGKTNLLEAIYMLATTKRLRGLKDIEVIRSDEDEAVIEAIAEEQRTSVSLKVGRSKHKKAFINGQSLASPSELLGRVPMVVFSASDLPIVYGEPKERRAFLDLQLSQIYPRYLAEFSTYKRALDQRNALLKRAQIEQVAPQDFEPWETQLTTSAQVLWRYRTEFIQSIEGSIQQRHAELGGGEHIGIELVSEQELELAQTRTNDIRRGSTSIGPHRDDLGLLINNMDARRFGSQGQQRTAVIALKLAVFGFLQEQKGTKPILLLDDIFSDLDRERRGKLIEIIAQEAGQVVLTCTDAAQAGVELGAHAHQIQIQGGQVLL